MDSEAHSAHGRCRRTDRPMSGEQALRRFSSAGPPQPAHRAGSHRPGPAVVGPAVDPLELPENGTSYGSSSVAARLQLGCRRPAAGASSDLERLLRDSLHVRAVAGMPTLYPHSSPQIVEYQQLGRKDLPEFLPPFPIGSTFCGEPGSVEDSLAVRGPAVIHILGTVFPLSGQASTVRPRELPIRPITRRKEGPT